MDHVKLHTVREAAASLGLSVACIRSWVAQRRIGYVRLGRAIRVPASEIERLVESGYVPVRVSRRGDGCQKEPKVNPD